MIPVAEGRFRIQVINSAPNLSNKCRPYGFGDATLKVPTKLNFHFSEALAVFFTKFNKVRTRKWAQLHDSRGQQYFGEIVRKKTVLRK